MKRGDVVTVAAHGDFGKPRPAVVIQSRFFDAFDTVVVLLITSELVEPSEARPFLTPSDTNGLRRRSQVMVDKVQAIRRDRIGSTIGHLTREEVVEIDRRLALLLGFAE